MSCPSIVFSQYLMYDSSLQGLPTLPIAIQIAQPGSAEWLAIVPGIFYVQGVNYNSAVTIRLYKGGGLQQTGVWISSQAGEKLPDVSALATNAIEKLPWNSDGEFLVEIVSPGGNTGSYTFFDLTIIGYNAS
jgi:hypothetical protein